jgi:hypothetical protein
MRFIQQKKKKKSQVPTSNPSDNKFREIYEMGMDILRNYTTEPNEQSNGLKNYKASKHGVLASTHIK